MIILTVIFVAIVAFFCGLAVGIREVPQKTYTKKQKPDEDLIKLQKEYENFLNYDGSIQQ